MPKTERRYWLMKSEPESFSIDDLLAAPGRTTGWDGVRNYQARNFMREMRVGDGVLVYHSNAEPSAVVGVATIVGEAHVDPTQFDPNDHHFDPKSKPANPLWSQVSVRGEGRLKRTLPLGELREVPGLEGLELLRKGTRLSVHPVSAAHWSLILKLGGYKEKKG